MPSVGQRAASLCSLRLRGTPRTRVASFCSLSAGGGLPSPGFEGPATTAAERKDPRAARAEGGAWPAKRLACPLNSSFHTLVEILFRLPRRWCSDTALGEPRIACCPSSAATRWGSCYFHRLTEWMSCGAWNFGGASWSRGRNAWLLDALGFI